MTTNLKLGRRGVLALGAAVPTLVAGRAIAADTLACGVGAASADQVLEPARVEAWLAAYRAAWEERDADKAVAIFTPDAKYHENPFDEVMVGSEAIHAYWSGAVSDQRDPAVETTLWSVSDTIAIAHWAAAFETISGDLPIKLEGVFHLTFDAASDPLLCSHLREWWFVQA